MSLVFASLTALSLLLAGWQWFCSLRFPLHARVPARHGLRAVTLLKPIRGWDEQTAQCVQSWLQQDYPAPVQVLFGVDEDDIPARRGLGRLIASLPADRARLVLCHRELGPHPKVAKLVQLYAHAMHGYLVVGDADVWAPPDFLDQATPLLEDPQVGMVNCLYCQPEALTPAMRWTQTSINADFWTQVLQSNSIQPQTFALGAVMITRRAEVEAIGGFGSYIDYFADDYQLGHRIAQLGRRIALSPVVVECRSPAMSWRQVWNHQLRQAKTIRACRPIPYFFSLLNNVTLWCLLWLLTAPVPLTLAAVSVAQFLRWVTALHHESRLCRARPSWPWFWFSSVKDLLQALVWAGAFLGNTVTWRGQQFRLRKGGRLERIGTVSPGGPTAARNPALAPHQDQN
jgi:ceramide glucosyltransferase